MNLIYIIPFLTDPSNQNSGIIENWFAQYWKTQYSDQPEKQRQLMAHLIYLLQSSKFVWPMDTNVVTQAQQALQKQPLSQIGFMMLDSQYKQPDVPLFPNTSPENLSKVTIPV